MARNGVDIATMTMVLRSEHYDDESIREAYQEVSTYSITEDVRGSYYIVLL